MLVLKNIGMDFPTGQNGGKALRCVNLVCRSRELIMITGPNGSGKTLLLQVIAGTLPFTRGEMLWRGRSLRKISEGGMSAYRRSVACADPERLLPDRTIAENAALGLMLSGVSRRGSRREALETLERMGLERMADCYPSQLSSSGRKLAALACAFASDPDILLADEPVQGLDPVWAKRVLGLLRESAGHCLVITASRKAIFPENEVRTVRMKDGTPESDNAPRAPYTAGESSMPPRRGIPAGRALSMALTGLLHQKGHPLWRSAVAFFAAFCMAGAMLLAVGMIQHSHILQKTTLSAYPVTVAETDLTSGDLHALGTWLEKQALPEGALIQYHYGTVPWVFSPDTSAGAVQVNPDPDNAPLWAQLPDGAFTQSRYELLSGRWPQRWDELVIIRSSSGDYSTAGLASLGFRADPETGEWPDPGFDRLSHMTFRLVLPVDVYYPNADGTWGDLRGDEDFMRTLVQRSPSLKIVGILCPTENSGSGKDEAFVGYTAALTEHISQSVLSSDLVRAQEGSPMTDILTGLPFDSEGCRSYSVGEKAAAMPDYIRTLTPQDCRHVFQYAFSEDVDETEASSALLKAVEELPVEEAAALFDQFVLSAYSESSLEENLADFGAHEARHLTKISLYADDLDSRAALTAVLDSYGDDLHREDSLDTMIHSASGFARLLERVLPLCAAITAVIGLLSVAAVCALGVRGRRSELFVLRCRGLGMNGAMRILLWDAVFTAFLPGAAGAAAAYGCAGLFPALFVPVSGCWWILAAYTFGTAVSAGAAGVLSVLRLYNSSPWRFGGDR